MKFWTVLAAILVAFSAGAVLLNEGASVSDAADDEQTANHSLKGDVTSVKTGGELTFEISFTETVSGKMTSVGYTAKLTNSSGTTQTSAVDPSSGDLSSGDTATLTVTAPSSAGTYTLTVTWTETLSAGGSMTYTDSLSIRVVTPITLSATVSNNGEVDIDTTVYFFVDGNKVEDSATTLKVSSGSSSTITYKYYEPGLSSGQHSFYVATSDGSIVLEKSTFYYEDENYDWLNYIMAMIFIVVIIAFIYVVRKPVKNYGKPKARR